MSTNGTFRLVAPMNAVRLRTDPAEVEKLLAIEDRRELSIHKSWQALHWLITGLATGGDGPTAFICAGGKAVGPDLGHGPARLLDPQAVKDLAAALEPLSPEQLGKRYDAAKMTDLAIYPGGWAEKESSWRGSLIQHYDELRALIKDGAQSGMALLVVVR
jgi:hypothetical protein